MFFKKKKPEPPPSAPLHPQPMAPTAISGGQSLFAPGLNPSTPAIDFGFGGGEQVPLPSPLYAPAPLAPMAAAEVVSFESGLNNAVQDMAALASQPLDLPGSSAEVHPRPDEAFEFEQQWASPEMPIPEASLQTSYSGSSSTAATEPILYEAYPSSPVTPEFADPGLPHPQMSPSLQSLTPEQSWESFTPQPVPPLNAPSDLSVSDFEGTSFEAGIGPPLPMTGSVDVPIPSAESAALAAFADMPGGYAPEFPGIQTPSLEQAFYEQSIPGNLPMPPVDSMQAPVDPLSGLPSGVDSPLSMSSADSFNFALEETLLDSSVPPVWEIENPTPPGTTFFASNEDYLKAKAAAFENAEFPMPLSPESSWDSTGLPAPDTSQGIEPSFEPVADTWQAPLPPVAVPDADFSAHSTYEAGLDAAVAHGSQTPLSYPPSPVPGLSPDPNLDSFYLSDSMPSQTPGVPSWEGVPPDSQPLGSSPLGGSDAGHFLDSVNEQLYPMDPFAVTGNGDLMAGEQAFAEAAQILFPETMDAPLILDEEASVASDLMSASGAEAGVYWPPTVSESDVLDLGPSFQATRSDLSDVSSALPVQPEPVSFEWTDDTSIQAESSLAAPVEEWQWGAEPEPRAGGASDWQPAESLPAAAFLPEAGTAPIESSISGNEATSVLPSSSLADISDTAGESWLFSLEGPVADGSEAASLPVMESYQGGVTEVWDGRLSETGFESPSELTATQPDVPQGEEFRFAAGQSDETAFISAGDVVPRDVMPTYGASAMGLDATAYAATEFTDGMPVYSPEIPSPMPVPEPEQPAAMIGQGTSRLGHLEILGVCLLDAEKRLLVVHNGDVFALMGQAGQDNPDVSVLRIFDSNPIAYQNTFTAVPEKRPDREGLYLVQVGTWRGVVSTFQDKMALYTDLG